MTTKNPVRRVTRTKAQARAAYNRMSRWYDLLGAFERKYREAGVQMLAPTGGEQVLEIGFGTGHSLVELARRIGDTGHVHGIDLSDGMRDIAQKRVDRAGVASRVTLARGDAVKLPFDNAAFDGIFMSFTLELFDTPEIPLVLAECMRTLRVGGRLCVVALSKNGNQTVTQWYEWVHDKFPQVADCRPIYVEEALDFAGFNVRQVTERGMYGLCCALVLAVKIQGRRT